EDRCVHQSLTLFKEFVRTLILEYALNIMKGLGKWASAVFTTRSARLKAQKKKTSSQGKSLLSKKEQSSGSGESAAIHFVQSDLACFSDEASESDNDPAVVRTVETRSVAGSDKSALKQAKEARSSGGIPSQ
ncbi:MAG: hypothetical protein KGD60_16060, partial [Candidatus Thorarchaeota archaeon]|nr:hypothetical protein [Candidatus Thorarchaeota archaeon]